MICRNGHQTKQTDFCDVCGLPLTDIAGPVTATTSPTLNCPSCQTVNVAEALFCEACGYDFTTGADSQPQWPNFAASSTNPQQTANPNSATPAEASGPVDPKSPLLPAVPAAEAVRPRVEWVAELWIDPDWYAAQGSTDPMPSVGLPDIVPLVKEANLVGRVSHAKGVFPEIDCELDSGCSRRHAMITTDWTRWWVEDLNSANGTFVAGAASPLPAMPIPQGRVQLQLDQRIYLGAWTRIVIRRADAAEQEAFA